MSADSRTVSDSESAASEEEKEEEVSLRSITAENVAHLRQINSIVFPIKYSPQFYTEVQKPAHAPFCKIVYVRGEPAGTICCRLELVHDEVKLYLMTMGVLARFRDHGVGTRALLGVLGAARASAAPRIASVYLHVQVSNADARRFYHRHGFVEVGLAEGYYKKIQPRDAWILECRLHPTTAPDVGVPDVGMDTESSTRAVPSPAPTPTQVFADDSEKAQQETQTQRIPGAVPAAMTMATATAI